MYTKGDFHIHTMESDGDLRPGEVVLLAKERKIHVIAITDHNTVNGNKEAIKVGKIHGIKVIPGIELSTRFKGNRVHILGYFRNDEYKGEEFKRMLDAIRKGRFKECQIFHKGAISFKSEGGKITTSAGIEFLHHYGAIVILAHPILLKREVFYDIVNLKFDGIEAKYYRNKEEDTEEFLKVVKEKGMIYTAGSDFHSLNKIDLKHGTLGQIFLEEEEIKDFLKRLK